MILQSQLLQSASKSSAAGFTSEMERSELIELVRELQGTVQTLLDSNLALSKRIDTLLSKNDEKDEIIKTLMTELARYKGNDAASKRNRFGKGGEKRSGGDS